MLKQRIIVSKGRWIQFRWIQGSFITKVVEYKGCWMQVSLNERIVEFKIVESKNDCIQDHWIQEVLGWVNPSKRGWMDGVFRGLAGLLRGISRGRCLSKILSPASPRKPCPSRLFYLDLHSISNRFSPLSKIATKCEEETIFCMANKATFDAKY